MNPSAKQGLGEQFCPHSGVSQSFSSGMELLIFQNLVYPFHFEESLLSIQFHA